MTRVKVCGITALEDALRAADLGADAVGFIFYPKSPRYIPPPEAAEIIRRLPPFVASVGVFVDCPSGEIDSIAAACSLTAVQLHGSETPEFCDQFRMKVIKAFRVRNARLPQEIEGYRTDAILLDAFVEGSPGGTGKTFCWEVAREAKRFGRVILAGGLNCENIRNAIETVRPYAVDVSSGVETGPGKKDPKRLAEFLKTVKEFRD
ncbi:MAG: phosphoribosylanthranilate isomerase, partial [Thermodesulfobacteriota bacterium]